MYQVKFYTTEAGESPVTNYLLQLDVKARAKIVKYLELLQQQGPNLKRPYSDVVRGKIRELRVEYQSNQYRVLYFFFHRNEIILVHAFSKKSQKLKEQDIELAEGRMTEWISRSNVE
ncbi:MAG TPA: type II toxin-antitoxin system RelE/ParE family toxin [Candidatus Hodarchaeales archaeon]|nr:type II toxin-antitoxin system RelE/ParE family toxin [Candidatus Hodarchaeales archaeon]